MTRTLCRGLGILTLILCLLPMPILAQDASYVGRKVKIRKENGRVLVGKVIKETPDELVLQMPYGKATIPRTEISEIIDAEALFKEYEARKKKCKTGADFWKLAVWAEKNELDRKLVRDTWKETVKADTNHEKARNKLGYKKVPDGRGGFNWVYTGEKKARDAINDTIKENKDAIKERPWEDYEVIKYFPNKQNPIYEIHTNCPESLCDDYGQFMVKLKVGLTKLVQSIQKKPIKWRNLGPGKIFICNSQKLFIEITGQREGVGGFYTPGYFPAGEAERCIVAFHGTFGFSGDTYKVLGHEGTHQLQGRMWHGNFSARPPWLIEGLAVYFGDGHYITKDGKFHVGIPRDRLNTLRRGFSSGKYVKLASLLFTPYQQFSGFHYAHGWGLIYWMLHSGESITFKGTTYDLKKVFGDFFDRNLAQGFQNLPGLFGARSREEVMALAGQMEEPWKRYINTLTPPSVGVFDKRNKRKFISESIGFSIEAPRTKKKKAWEYIPEVDLNTGELVGLTQKGTSARFTIGQAANTEALLDVDKVARGMVRLLAYSYEGFRLLKGEKLSLRGQPVYAMNFVGKERKTNFNDSPYPKKVRIRTLVYLAGKNYFTLKCQSDFDKWEETKGDFTDIVNGFNIIAAKK